MALQFTDLGEQFTELTSRSKGLSASYTREEFHAKLEELDQAHQAELNKNINYTMARIDVDNAQMAVEQARTRYSEMQLSMNMLIPWQRRKRLEALDAAERAEALLAEKEQKLNQVLNDFAARKYAKQLEAKHEAERERHEKEEAQRSMAIESEAREALRSAYLANGGTEQQFIRAWPDMWKRELEKRAFEGVDAAKQRMIESGRYNL